jgi:flagellar hook-basal body complex protein FliE
VISPILAAKAYAAVQKSSSVAGGEAAESIAGPSFADIASRHAESQIAAHAQGKTELVNVVTAVASAQSSLETVIAVRDQVISAYQEIMRMPI